MNVKRKVIRALKPRAANLIQVMLAHGDANGALNYDELDAKMPDWRAGYRDRAEAINDVNRLRNGGRFAFEKKRHESGGAIEIVEAAPNELSEAEKLVLEIAKTYTRDNGTISLRQAVAEHPEWGPMFQYGKKDGVYQKGANLISSMRRRKLLPQLNGSAKVKNPKHRLAALARWEKRREQLNGHAPAAGPAPLTPEQEKLVERMVQKAVGTALDAIVEKISFCPKCGNHLLPMLRQAALEAKF